MTKPTQGFFTMSDAELHQRLAQTRQELFALRLKARQGALEQPHRIQQSKRDIARMMTALRQQRLKRAQP